MLTGDKPETAMCIARSSQLIGRDQSFCRVLLSDAPPDYAQRLDSREVGGDPRMSYVLNALRKFELCSANDRALVVDGATLSVLLSDYRQHRPRNIVFFLWEKFLRFWGWRPHGKGTLGGGMCEQFVRAAIQAPAVVASRCSPGQKA